MQRSELGRAERCFGRHEIFSEKVSVLDHRALERLEDHPAFLEIFGNDGSFHELIIRENHPPCDLAETLRIFQNISAVLVRERSRSLEGFEIEKINIGETPWLIFAGRARDRFKLFPGDALLL